MGHYSTFWGQSLGPQKHHVGLAWCSTFRGFWTLVLEQRLNESVPLLLVFYRCQQQAQEYTLLGAEGINSNPPQTKTMPVSKHEKKSTENVLYAEMYFWALGINTVTFGQERLDLLHAEIL